MQDRWPHKHLSRARYTLRLTAYRHGYQQSNRRKSWYLAGWIRDSPIDFLVDPGDVCQRDIATVLRKTSRRGFCIHLLKKCKWIRGREQMYDSTWHVQFRIISTWISDSHGHGGNWSELPGHPRYWYFSVDATKLPFILDLVDGTLSGGGYETTNFTGSTRPRNRQTPFASHHTQRWCCGQNWKLIMVVEDPPRPVVLALQTSVQEFGILVGRSLVCADADDWKVPILLYNSDPCTRESKHCKRNPVIIPARTRIARVEEILTIQNIGTRETERST